MKLFLIVFFTMLNSNAYSLQITSYNIYGIPKPLKFSKQVKRGVLIGKTLLGTNSDVICFQEAFSRLMRKKILNELRDFYPYDTTYFIQRKFPVFINSGLWCVSKYPINVLEHHYFTTSTHNDRFASKGALLLELILPDQKRLQILNTHLQAWNTKKIKQIRKKQLLEIVDLLERHKINEVPQLILGDLNIDAYEPNEYQILREILEIDNVLPQSMYKFSCDDKDNTFSELEDTGKLLDYISFRQSETTPWQVLDKKILKLVGKVGQKIIDLSDHYAITAKVEFHE